MIKKVRIDIEQGQMRSFKRRFGRSRESYRGQGKKYGCQTTITEG